MVMNGISLSTIDTAPDNVKTWLTGEPLKMLVNAGMVGLKPPSYYSQEEIDQRYAAHLLTAHRLPLAFQDLLVESHGTIVNLTNVEMLEHERSITSHPSTNGGIKDVTESLRSTLAPHDVEVITIVEEANGQLRSMTDDFETRSNASALAQDILRDISRLPGYDRAI